MRDDGVVAQALLGQARSFVADHVAGQIAQFLSERRSSLDLMVPAARQGLLGIQVSPSHGGLGLPFSSKMQAMQILAEADFGLAMSVVNTHNVAEHVARMADPKVAKAIVPDLLSGKTTACTALTEPGAGSDFASIQTTAVPAPGGWLLSGDKTWITNAHHAVWFVVYAQTQASAGAAGIAAFLVDARQSGFVRHAGLPMGPSSTAGTGGFGLDNYFCPSEHLLAAPGEAFKDIMRSINGARTYVAAMCCGMVAECLRQAQAYGNERKAFGKPLLAHQGWRWALADADIDLKAAQCLVDEAARYIDQGQDAQLVAARAKVFATRMAQRHIGALMHAMGAAGLHEHLPFVRHLAGAQLAGLVAGSTEMLLERISKEFKTASRSS